MGQLKKKQYNNMTLFQSISKIILCVLLSNIPFHMYFVFFLENHNKHNTLKTIIIMFVSFNNKIQQSINFAYF